MGTMTQKMKDWQNKRLAYQEKMKIEVMQRVAGYMSERDRELFLSGEGFVVLPEQERQRLRIDSYPFLR